MSKLRTGKIEDYQKILEDAPEGATHLGDNGVYYKRVPYEPLPWCSAWDAECEEWVETTIIHLSISLDHLRVIVAQNELIEKLRGILFSMLNTEGGALEEWVYEMYSTIEEVLEDE